MTTDPSNPSGSMPYRTRKRQHSFDNETPRRWKMTRQTVSSPSSSRCAQGDEDSDYDDEHEYERGSIRQRRVVQPAR